MISRKHLKEGALLFGALWLVYGATIDRADLFNYGLQQGIVESIVERGTYQVGGSELPNLNDTVDVFLYEGRVLPAKQPGQATFGAAVYYLCSRLGITYRSHFFLAAALVTWLTASLAAAASGAALYLIVAGVWGLTRLAGLGSALGGSLATIVLPYAGVAHHDVIASSFALIAYLLIELSAASGRHSVPALLVAGLLLGGALFTSMLPTIVVMILLAYASVAAGWTGALAAWSGMVLGLTPLGLYNLHYFHNALTQANIAGGFEDTYPRFDLTRFVHHVDVYLGLGDLSLIKYMPILPLAAAGIPMLGKGRSRQMRLLFAIAAGHLLYVLSISTIGHCQYGPRYVLPIVPFCMLGMAGWLDSLLRSPIHRWGTSSIVWTVCVGCAAFYSFVVNLLGALCGTMFCETQKFAFLEYLSVIPLLQLQLYPLAPACLGIATVWGAMSFLKRLLPSRREVV